MQRVININEEAIASYKNVSQIAKFGILHAHHPRFVKLKQGNTTLLCMEKGKVRIMGKSKGVDREEDLEKLLEKLKIQLKNRRISNIVLHCSVSPKRIDLQKVGNSEKGTYEPERVPSAAFYKCVKGKATLYYTGKIEIMGCQSLEDTFMNMNETLIFLISNNCLYGQPDFSAS